MANTGHHGAPDVDEARMGKMLVRSMIATTPVAVVVIMLTVLFTTDRSLAASFGSAILPGILVGVFGGGFIGMILTGE